MLRTVKERLAGFLRWHVTEPVVAMQRELSYQNLSIFSVETAALLRISIRSERPQVMV